MGVSDSWRLMFDLEMCARATRFFGSDYSTVSFVVLQWRRYRFKHGADTAAFWPAKNMFMLGHISTYKNADATVYHEND